MRCEEVRELLPAYVDPDLHVAGPVEIHLAGCDACSADLAAYRGLLAALYELRELGEEPGAGFLESTLARIEPPTAAARILGSVNDRRVRLALASIGTVAIGAAAVAIMLRRRHATRLAAAG